MEGRKCIHEPNGRFMSYQNTLPGLTLLEGLDPQHNRGRYAEMLLHLQQSQPELRFVQLLSVQTQI